MDKVNEMEVNFIMNYADIKPCDVANGTGVRVSLFVSGCTHHCKGCFNPETWDFNYGKAFTTKEEDYIIELAKGEHIAGLTILGGEPMEFVNQQGLLPLVKRFKETYPDKNIWCYTGYDFEKNVLEKMYHQWDFTPSFLSYIDVMVDGEFMEDKKVIDLRFRGSTNQRIIDVQKSLSEKKAVLWDEKGRFF
jgi:anaerobic ribonucleoside-triphosphate reductase activating protein